jgi:uncharacterized protein (DUF433 family)
LHFAQDLAAMAITIEYPHLAVDDAGSIHIVGSRYKVLHLAGEHYHYGWTAEELLRQHPDLRPEEVYSALAFFYDHFDELVPKLAASPAGIREPSVTRAELLQRQATKST